MSNVTLHPKSQNFLVDMREECAKPGTMCASVISSGSHGISRLPVCVDWMCFPFGSVIVIGFSAIFFFTIGAPSTKKWPVAPESEMACFTDLVTLAASKMEFAMGRDLRLFTPMSCCHAVDLVCMGR